MKIKLIIINKKARIKIKQRNNLKIKQTSNNKKIISN